LLSGYLDLELPAETCAEVEAHLADCPPCIEFAESLRKTVEICRRYQPAELPTPLGDKPAASYGGLIRRCSTEEGRVGRGHPRFAFLARAL